MEQNNIKLPYWARKPSHNREEVVATERGWETASGEILLRVNDLPRKLQSLAKSLQVIATQIVPGESTEVEDAPEIEPQTEDSQGVPEEPSAEGVDTSTVETEEVATGSPESSETKVETPAINTVEEKTQQPKKRGGRPKGSKNKPKVPLVKTDGDNKRKS